MTALTTQDITPLGGTTITFTQSTAADTAACENTLLVNNASGVSTTITIATPGTVSGLAIAEQAIPVAPGTIEAIPLPKSLYEDSSDGRAHFGTSPTTSVTLAVVSAKA